ncbi:transcription factor LHW [Melia azedarach]|uniref:Transcription factor LHW n=1 Tax=Melia azedarach TaxID=155640 RepID=A0ACC1YMA0_MELAZ|nr:transcription factor LHW [Melia azedarach]
MGVMLKQVLKALCAGNQWCYAVFWKIGCQNTKLLIWEECHLESMPLPQIPLGEWEGCWGSSETISQLGIQGVQGVQVLINKMMMNNQVNVVGEGLVGRAAFTGNHQWFLANNHIGDAHPPEVHNEVHLQFSAGMQTVAVIPVLPHGVIQLGSSSAIVENIGFVNYVKSLILQLGCVPGALLPENYGIKEPAVNDSLPVSNRMLVSDGPSGIFKATSYSLAANVYNQQSSSSQPSRMVGQLLGSLGRQIQHSTQSTTPMLQNPNPTQMLGKSHGGRCESNFTPAMKDLPFGGQQANGVVGANVIPASSNTWPNQQCSFYGSRSAYHYQPVVDQSSVGCSSFKLIEQQNLADAADHAPNNVDESKGDSFAASQSRKNGGLTEGSLPTQCLKRSGLHGGMSSQKCPVSVPCSIPNHHKSADNNIYSTNVASTGLKSANSSKAEEIPLSSLVDQVTSSHILSRGSVEGHSLLDAKHTPIGLASRKVDNDLFQALNNPLTTHLDKHMPLSGQIPGFVNDCRKPDYEDMTLKSSNAKFEDGCMQPSSGDDLFDILGVDFKNKLLNGDLNSFLADGHNTVDGGSMSMNAPDVSTDFYSVNEGILDSCTFSGMGTEHLLDAVVSRAHSVAKQISDDNVSCGTTLTKTSSSSIPTISPSCGQVNISNVVQGELFGLPKSLAKSGTVASTSFQSGCSKDNEENCSQTTSIYGSHISSWVEQGHNVKRDRPRPKDRQMIQDRVKELREIVPNGAKCSIDALLERTIKHMLFLQSVTKHADKLKQTGESKIISKDGGLLLKDNFEGGATWAFEVGSQSMVCPIIVEDLNPPRQMLVEMLCEERGLFLEIADLIRGLGLTILKGVMESRNDKIWARFAVEANRDVTRMEIFMSLVRLLEQTVKGSTMANAFDSNNMMVHHSFPQATSIPATGRPSSLQ